MMKRPAMNFLIDAAAFAAFALLFSTGLVMRYQLPPGSGDLESHGGGRGAAYRLVSVLWGWTRHEWGAFHFWIAVALSAILALHLLLHWKWIVCMIRGTHSDASGWRLATGAVALVALIALAASPFIAPPQRLTREQLKSERVAASANADAVDQQKE
jgi:hypothetical protein